MPPTRAPQRILSLRRVRQLRQLRILHRRRAEAATKITRTLRRILKELRAADRSNESNEARESRRHLEGVPRSEPQDESSALFGRGSGKEPSPDAQGSETFEDYRRSLDADPRQQSIEDPDEDSEYYDDDYEVD